MIYDMIYHIYISTYILYIYNICKVYICTLVFVLGLFVSFCLLF